MASSQLMMTIIDPNLKEKRVKVYSKHNDEGENDHRKLYHCRFYNRSMIDGICSFRKEEYFYSLNGAFTMIEKFFNASYDDYVVTTESPSGGAKSSVVTQEGLIRGMK